MGDTERRESREVHRGGQQGEVSIDLGVTADPGAAATVSNDAAEAFILAFMHSATYESRQAQQGEP